MDLQERTKLHTFIPGEPCCYPLGRPVACMLTLHAARSGLSATTSAIPHAVAVESDRLQHKYIQRLLHSDNLYEGT
jgi:hypothetical protein